MGKSYGEAICNFLHGKNVDVFLGTTSKTYEYIDHSVVQKEVLRGIVKESCGDLLILEIAEKENTYLAYVNVWNIILITENRNGNSVDKIMCDATPSKKRKN